VFERLSVELARQRDAAAATDWRAFVEADRAFHAITLQESGNAILSGFYTSLRDRQMRMIGQSALRDPDRVATILKEHRDIAEALRDGDIPRAVRAVRTHLAGTVRAMGLAFDAL
jgi:DNA-binding GntR family transcriptional regulator